MSEPTATPHENTHPAAVECCGEASGEQGCGHPHEGGHRPGPLDVCPTPLSWRQVLEAYRHESQVVEVARPGGAIEARVWGEGPPLYLLCGMGGTAEQFCLLNYLLRDLFRCVTFDYPGTLAPRRGRGRLTLEGLTSDVVAVADQLGDASLTLFATSFGSLVALNTLLTAGDRIERAIIQGGFAHRRLSFAEKSAIQLGRLLPGRLRSLRLAKWIQEQNHRRWFPGLDATRWEFFLEDVGGVPLASLAQRGRIISKTDFRPLLSKITHPVMLIQCEGDGLVGRSCHIDLENGLPHRRSEWMHSAGHLPHLTSPHRLAKLIRDFASQGVTPVGECRSAETQEPCSR